MANKKCPNGLTLANTFKCLWHLSPKGLSDLDYGPKHKVSGCLRGTVLRGSNISTPKEAYFSAGWFLKFHPPNPSFRLLSFPFFIFYFFLRKGVELRTSHSLGRHSTTRATHVVLLDLILFQVRSCIFCCSQTRQWCSTCISCLAGIIGAHHHAQCTCWGGASLTFNLGLL
jgi:hypothetical protein